VCTHFHIDHSNSNVMLRERSGAEIWIHELDAPALRSLDNFVSRYGFEDEQMLALWRKFLADFGVRAHEVDHEFRDGDVVPGDFRVIHTPGHTPGHCSFYKDGVLIAGDIDLTVPWLGNVTSNAGDFIASIERLEQMDIQTLLPGHGVPVFDHIQDGLEEFRQKLLRREVQLVELLGDGPLSLEELAARVDKAKQERRGQEDEIQRSPFAEHFHYTSILNSLKHLQETGRVELVDDGNGAIWKVV
jgi:glyoxylase-like metal-dependent hydrolase (beta-lactamase superfamily II)